MQEIYECEEMIKKYTKDNYKQKNDNIFTICHACNFWINSQTEKTQKVSLVTGDFKCEHCRRRR